MSDLIGTAQKGRNPFCDFVPEGQNRVDRYFQRSSFQPLLQARLRSESLIELKDCEGKTQRTRRKVGNRSRRGNNFQHEEEIEADEEDEEEVPAPTAAGTERPRPRRRRCRRRR